MEGPLCDVRFRGPRRRGTVGRGCTRNRAPRDCHGGPWTRPGVGGQTRPKGKDPEGGSGLRGPSKETGETVPRRFRLRVPAEATEE